MILSLIAVCLAFTALVLWVYWPSHRERFERQALIALHDDDIGPNHRPTDVTRGAGSTERGTRHE